MLQEILDQNRASRPMVHCMVNLVTANDCANLTLASGASPIMAEDLEEVAEVTASCDSLVLNLGTPNPRKIKALLRAGCTARAMGRPIVFDPVGVGCSELRKQAAADILAQAKPTVIRGNASEIRTLVTGAMASRGVDVDEVQDDHMVLASRLAQITNSVVVLSADTDIVTDGTTSFRVYNGHPMMRSVTGTGCQLSVLLGAYVASNPERPLAAALAAVCALGYCGELAYKRLTAKDGNACYRNYIIDAIYHLTGDELEKGANYEIY